jgi:hypothetical protein
MAVAPSRGYVLGFDVDSDHLGRHQVHDVGGRELVLSRRSRFQADLEQAPLWFGRRE